MKSPIFSNDLIKPHHKCWVRIVICWLLWVQSYACFSLALFATDTLPVVVHVIHTGTPVGSADNPADNDIHALIELINDAFQKNGAFYGGADIELAFALAQRSPFCGSTTGINRVDGSSVADYETGGITTDTNFFPGSAHELFVKALSRWPNTDYINIWIVNMIDGDPGGIAGYAYFPQYNSAMTDGIVLRADAVNGTNKTIIHEFGHFFNLLHTFGNAWGGCLAEPNCVTDGDQVCDTEHCRFEFNCLGETNPCTGNPYEIADPEFDYTVLHNYMGYTNCQWMFTEDQKDRMLNALADFRPGLISSNAWQAPSNLSTDACAPGAMNGLSPFYGIERVIFGPLNVYSNSSQADGAFYVDRRCNQMAVIHAGVNVPIAITGSFQNTQHIKVYLDLNHNGQCELPAEQILSGFSGSVSGSININPAQIDFCEPMLLRVVTDHPAAPSPTPCLLTGTAAQGVGQMEDYTVVVVPRSVASINSGNWNNVSTWSCSCIPGIYDRVTIREDDIVIVPSAMGTVTCASLELEPGAMLNNFAQVRVVPVCNE